MALQQAGVQLVAQGSGAFASDLSKSERAVVQFGSSVVAQERRIAGLTDKIGFQQRQLGLLQAELKQAADTYGDSSIQAQKKQLAVDKLTASIRRNESELESANRTLTDSKQSLGQAEKAVTDFAKEADDAGKKTGRFGDIARGAFERVGHVAVDFAMNAISAVAGFGAEALDMAQDYEQSMNVLQVQSQASEHDMEAVRQKARELGADLTLPGVSAATAGEAMLELSKGGLDLQESMDAAKGALMLAAAAETDVATAANITTGALAAFGLEGEKAGYIADVLANSANLSRASITDMSQGFQQAAFRFKSAGQGADDLAASLVILTKNGLSGSDAGTALQNMLARLQGPTDKAAGLMKELGINVYDAQGNMLPMSGIIAEFQDALGGMTQQERNAALQTILLGDGMKAMIPLLSAGSQGFEDIKGKVNRAGAAQELAAAQMKGLRGATEGLRSTLETLALEGLEPLLPLMANGVRRAAEFAGSFTGKVGPAVKAIIKFVGEAGDVFQAVFVPAVSAAGAALLLYAVSSIPAAVTALPGLIAQITRATTAFATQAVTLLPVIAAFGAVAIAGVGVVKAYQGFQEKIDNATQSLLESRTWWQNSTQALENYGASSTAVQEKVSAHAATIRELRSEIESEVRSLGLRLTTGDLTQAQYDTEMAAVNRKREALIIVTDAMNNEISALVKTEAAQTTATAKTHELAAAQPILQEQIQLTAEDFQKLAEEFASIMQKGGEALSTLASTHATFTANVEAQQSAHKDAMTRLTTEMEAAQTEEQRAGIADRMDAESNAHQESLSKLMQAYAEQAAAQRQALGEQLLAYIENQRQMGNITDEKAAEIREKTITHFGIMRDSAAAMFGEMAMSVDAFARGAVSDADDVASAWQETEDAAADLRARANELKDKYIMEIIADFNAGRITIDEAKRQLASVPKRVESEIVVRHITVYETRGDNVSDGGVSGYRAQGGPVSALNPYIVGEQGRELFIPASDGFVVKASDTRRIIEALSRMERVQHAPPPAQVLARSTAATVNNYYGQVGNSYKMPVYTSHSPSVIGQSFAIAQAMSFG